MLTNGGAVEKKSTYTQELEEYKSVYRKDFANLDKNKISILHDIYMLGKVEDLSFSLMAIAWGESSIGKLQINVNEDNSWDCGLFGNNTNSVLERKKHIISYANKQLVCTRLITERLYALENAVHELRYWMKQHEKLKGSEFWRTVWGAYNGGWSPKRNYALKIEARIAVLSENLDTILDYSY